MNEEAIVRPRDFRNIPMYFDLQNVDRRTARLQCAP